MKTKLIFICAFFIQACMMFGQSYQPGKLWVSVTNDDARSVFDSITKVEKINYIFESYRVSSYLQIMGFAKTPSLRNIYGIECDCNEEDLRDRLLQEVPEYFRCASSKQFA